MGRLVPIFEDTGRGKLFEGKFRDEETGREGFLEVPSTPGIGQSSRAVAVFVMEKKG